MKLCFLSFVNGFLTIDSDLGDSLRTHITVSSEWPGLGGLSQE